MSETTRRLTAGRHVATLLVVVALLVGCSGEALPTESDVPRAAQVTSDSPSPSAPGPTRWDPATQPVWDPASIETLPLRRTRLPEQIDLRSAHGPTLLAQPMSGIVAAMRDAAGLRLLDTDGTWRLAPVPPAQHTVFGVTDFARPAISSDGTRVAVALEAGIRVIDATTGDESTIPWPPRFSGRRDAPPSVVWQPRDDGFFVFDTVWTWLVALDGSHREAPFRSYAFGIDPDGPVYENAFRMTRLVTWAGDRVIDRSPFVQCERMVAAHGMVACTAGSLQSFRSGPVVVDPRTGKIIAYAPIKDRNSLYSDNGGLTVLGFLDEDTVLMVVGPLAFHRNGIGEERSLVSWQFRTGELQRISTGRLRSIAVAPQLLD
ncbi:hypothetical protein [Nocardioides astragali]|uniref:Lipoprotein LpqB beta-propeller domain-containing protein n=1 Tax=Nocardioides astragali TaxID=1776736 RepID=A0ABW2MZG2_9ACTN|nr:hypothetical protein [Nocardioides astragali]